jgi:chromosome segregation ATPase
MKKSINHKLQMLKVVQTVCSENSAAVTSITALNNAFIRLNGKIAEIDLAAQGHLTDNVGCTREKNQVKRNLTELAGKTAKAIMAYAHDHANENLEVEIHSLTRKLYRAGDNLLIEVSANVLSSANSLVAEIAEYGVDAAMLTTFESVKADFERLSPKVNDMRNRKKALTAKLETLTKECIDILKSDMDRLVEILGDAYAEFKILYKHARVIEGSRVRKPKPEPTPGA